VGDAAAGVTKAVRGSATVTAAHDNILLSCMKGNVEAPNGSPGFVR